VDPDLTGDPGWAGPEVLLLALDLDGGGPRVVARAALGTDGAVEIDDPAYRARWSREGVVGRAFLGRLYPSDGQDFLDELPFVYRGAYLRAVPADEVLGGPA